MTEFGSRLSGTIDLIGQAAAAAHQHFRARDVGARLQEFREKVRAAAPTGADLEQSDDTLELISDLVREWSQTRTSSPRILREIAGISNWLSTVDWPTDVFGERAEILCQAAFLGWRHARAVGDTPAAQHWVYRHDVFFELPSADRECLELFLGTPSIDRPVELIERYLSDAATLFGIAAIFRRDRIIAPVRVVGEIETLFPAIERQVVYGEFPGEKSAILADIAVSAAVATRWTAQRQVSVGWLDRAERLYGATPDRDAGLAVVELQRLAHRYEMGAYQQVLDLAGPLRERFGRLGMDYSVAVAYTVEAATLKNLCRPTETVPLLEAALVSSWACQSKALEIFVLQQLGHSYALVGREEDASRCFEKAISYLAHKNLPIHRAWLNVAVGETLQISGKLEDALASYHAASGFYIEGGAEGWAAYARLLKADVLLSLGRLAEANREIGLALPVLQALEMAPESFAALALVSEAARQQRIDRDALHELKEFLRRKRE